MRLDFPGVTGSGQIWMDVMNAICGDAADKSMVDLGCHRIPYTPRLGFKERTYVDVQERELDFEDERMFFFRADAISFMQQSDVEQYDVAICSDMIEHLTKEDGRSLLHYMWQGAKKSIVFTPIGDFNVTADDNPDSHKSGWMPEDFVGYATIVFPDFHPKLGIGAFFVFECEDLQEEFERVKNELKNKSWTKSVSSAMP